MNSDGLRLRAALVKPDGIYLCILVYKLITTIVDNLTKHIKVRTYYFFHSSDVSHLSNLVTVSKL